MVIRFFKTINTLIMEENKDNLYYDNDAYKCSNNCDLRVKSENGLFNMTVTSERGLEFLSGDILPDIHISLRSYDYKKEDLKNLIERLPDYLRSLVITLDLENNSIEEIPEEIVKLNNLRIINLYGNNLTFIPEFIIKLKRLQVFNLTYNKIKELPEFIGQCSQLAIIQLDGNELKTLPEKCLLEMPNICDLEVYENTDLVVSKDFEKIFGEKINKTRDKNKKANEVINKK